MTFLAFNLKRGKGNSRDTKGKSKEISKRATYYEGQREEEKKEWTYQELVMLLEIVVSVGRYVANVLCNKLYLLKEG